MTNSFSELVRCYSPQIHQYSSWTPNRGAATVAAILAVRRETKKESAPCNYVNLPIANLTVDMRNREVIAWRRF
jgi:hypothetical protein